MLKLSLSRPLAIETARLLWQHHRDRNDDASYTYELAVGAMMGLSAARPRPGQDDETISERPQTIPWGLP